MQSLVYETIRHKKPGTTVPFLPDLRLWYQWHDSKNSIPPKYEGEDLASVSRAIGVTPINYVRPWTTEVTGGTNEREKSSDGKRWTFGSEDEHLTAVWSIGPDGDYWQTEYPVKSAEDLAIVAKYLDRRKLSYSPSQTSAESDTVEIIELPSRPFAWFMLELVGFSEGLMILMDAETEVLDIIAKAEADLSELISTICAANPGSILLSPDNLDAYFISPGYFETYLAASYDGLATIADEHDCCTVVHAGGPVAGLAPLLADSRIDSIVGVAEAPQGDAGIKQIRELTQERIVPWGGIPQDFLLPQTKESDAIDGARRIASEARDSGAALLGIADHVPIEADIDRLATIASL